MTASTQQILTAEVFWQHYEGQNYELVRGEVIEKVPTGGVHGVVVGFTYLMLTLFSRSSGAVTGLESGFFLEHDPDVLRGPDVFYVRRERIPAGGVPTKFWEIAPDMAVEVVSPSESAAEVQNKIMDYLAAGTEQVWVVFPEARTVTVHTADNLARTYRAVETFEGSGVLEGFSCPIKAFFELTI